MHSEADMARNNDGKTYTDETGKFAEGNPGRSKGARHKVTQAVEALLEGQSEQRKRLLAFCVIRSLRSRLGLSAHL